MPFHRLPSDAQSILPHSFIRAASAFFFCSSYIDFFLAAEPAQEWIWSLFHHHLFALSICSWTNIFTALAGLVEQKQSTLTTLNSFSGESRQSGEEVKTRFLCGVPFRGRAFFQRSQLIRMDLGHISDIKRQLDIGCRRKNARAVHVLIIITDPLF